ncbi:MAG: TCR/Tet family MFS transporter [Euryarchaeota archaeon]|nr:TCR/Tet family MFS transporter [Euryarchaeota archaeon]
MTFVVLTVLIDAIGFGIIIPVTPGLILELTGEGLSQAAIYGGWLFFSFAAVQFVCAPVLGNLSDRFGRRPVLLVSLLAFGIDYLIMGVAPSLLWLFLGRILAGIPGAAYTTAYAYIADSSPPKKRTQNFGMVGAAFGIGFILGPALGGLLGQFGTRAPFFAAAALAFANCAFGFLVLRESLPKDRRRLFSWKRANPLGALIQLRRFPQVFGLAAALFLWALAGQVYPATWAFYTMQRFEWSVTLVGYSLAFVGVIMAVSQATLPKALMPRLGERRTVLIGLIAGSIGFMGFAFATAGWMMFAWLSTWFLAGLVMPGMNAMMSKEIPPTSQGELQGANASLFSLAAIVGPLVMAELFGTFSRSDAPFHFPGAAFFVASVLTLAAVMVFLGARQKTSAKDTTPSKEGLHLEMRPGAAPDPGK